MSEVDVDELMPEIEADEKPETPEVVDEGKEPEKAEQPEEKPEAKPEPEKPKADPKQEPRTLPLAAHLEERRAWAAEKRALEERLAKLENPPKAPDPEPEFQDDPKAYVDHKLQNALKALEGTTTEAKQTAEQAAAQATQTRFLTDLATAEQAFVKETPDYFDAVSHIRNIRVAQLQVFNPEITQQEIVETIRREEIGMAMQLARAGKNPIQAAYQLAKAYGYQPKKPADKQELQLPDVPGKKQLPPDQTLGTGGGGNADEQEISEDADPFDEAFNEMFRRKAS